MLSLYHLQIQHVRPDSSITSPMVERRSCLAKTWKMFEKSDNYEVANCSIRIISVWSSRHVVSIPSSERVSPMTGQRHQISMILRRSFSSLANLNRRFLRCAPTYGKRIKIPCALRISDTNKRHRREVKFFQELPPNGDIRKRLPLQTPTVAIENFTKGQFLLWSNRILKIHAKLSFKFPAL